MFIQQIINWAVDMCYATVSCNDQNTYSAYPQWDTWACLWEIMRVCSLPLILWQSQWKTLIHINRWWWKATEIWLPVLTERDIDWQPVSRMKQGLLVWAEASGCCLLIVTQGLLKEVGSHLINVPSGYCTCAVISALHSPKLSRSQRTTAAPVTLRMCYTQYKTRVRPCLSLLQ